MDKDATETTSNQYPLFRRECQLDFFSSRVRYLSTSNEKTNRGFRHRLRHEQTRVPQTNANIESNFGEEAEHMFLQSNLGSTRWKPIKENHRLTFRNSAVVHGQGDHIDKRKTCTLPPIRHGNALAAAKPYKTCDVHTDLPQTHLPLTQQVVTPGGSTLSGHVSVAAVKRGGETQNATLQSPRNSRVYKGESGQSNREESGRSIPGIFSGISTSGSAARSHRRQRCSDLKSRGFRRPGDLSVHEPSSSRSEPWRVRRRGKVNPKRKSYVSYRCKYSDGSLGDSMKVLKVGVDEPATEQSAETQRQSKSTASDTQQ